MPDQPPKLPSFGFADFKDSPGAGGRSRRGRRWSLWPRQEPGADQAVDAARFVKESDVYAGLGRKPAKE
jgi:hypothetical protein